MNSSFVCFSFRRLLSDSPDNIIHISHVTYSTFQVRLTSSSQIHFLKSDSLPQVRFTSRSQIHFPKSDTLPEVRFTSWSLIYFLKSDLLPEVRFTSRSQIHFLSSGVNVTDEVCFSADDDEGFVLWRNRGNVSLSVWSREGNVTHRFPAFSHSSETHSPVSQFPVINPVVWNQPPETWSFSEDDIYKIVYFSASEAEGDDDNLFLTWTLCVFVSPLNESKYKLNI